MLTADASAGNELNVKDREKYFPFSIFDLSLIIEEELLPPP